MERIWAPVDGYQPGVIVQDHVPPPTPNRQAEPHCNVQLDTGEVQTKTHRNSLFRFFFVFSPKNH